MNEINNYIKLQKIRGLTIGISGVIGLIAILVIFFMCKPDGTYIWWLFIPIIIMLGIVILGFGWFYMYYKRDKINK